MTHLSRGALGVTALLTIASLLIACAAPAAPTAAPTKPAAAPVATTAPASAATTAPAAAATKPAAPTATPAAKIKRGGTITNARAWTYPTFDPHVVSTPNLAGQRVLFDAPLFCVYNEQKKAFEVQPELFESWSFPNPTTAVFKVRKGVKFHDGTDLTPEVAAWNINRMVEHKKSTARIYIEGVKNAEADGPDSIKINMKAPQASLLLMLTGAYTPISIVSKAAVDKMGDDEFGRKAVGTGPFVFSNWISDDRLTVKKFDQYWKKGEDGQPLPYLDGMVFRNIPDTAVSVMELRAGSVDEIDETDPKDAATIKNDPNLTLIEIPASGRIFFYGGFNTRKGVFSDNLKLRQALNHAIDRDNMAKLVTFGMGQGHLYPQTGQGILGFDPSIKTYPFDLAKSKQLLTEAGYPNGVDIELSVMTREPERRLGEIAKQMFDNAGFRTKIDALERLAFNAKLGAGNFDLGYWRGSLPLDPDSNTRSFYSGGAGNWSGFVDPEVDKCMDEGRQEMDATKRHEIYKRCTNLVQERAYVFTGYIIKESAAARKTVKNIRFQGTLTDLREAWLDK